MLKHKHNYSIKRTNVQFKTSDSILARNSYATQSQAWVCPRWPAGSTECMQKCPYGTYNIKEKKRIITKLWLNNRLPQQNSLQH